MGIASYAPMIDGGSSNNNQQGFNATLPVQNFQETSFELTSQEMRVLAYQNDVVFVTGVYDTSSQKEMLKSELSDLPSQMNSRLYISLLNSSSDSIAANDIVTRFGLTEFPSAVVVGGSQGRSALSIVQEPSSDEVVAASCDAMRDWGQLSATCVQ